LKGDALADGNVPPEIRDPIAGAGRRFRERWVEAAPGVRLRVLSWTPLAETPGAALFFAAGWVSAVDGWTEVLREAARRGPVHYVETREKPSAVIDLPRPTPRDFSIPRVAADLAAVARHLALDPAQTLLAGSSFGATAILEGLKHGRLPARGAFLVGPNAAFRIPWLLRPLLHLPTAAYGVIKHFVLWYLRTFRVDARREPEQMERYRRTLLAAHPLRLKLSAQAAARYRVWADLETVRTPVALAYAPTDTLHDRTAIERLAQRLARGRTVPCPTNRYMHSAALVADMETFFGGWGAGS